MLRLWCETLLTFINNKETTFVFVSYQIHLSEHMDYANVQGVVEKYDECLFSKMYYNDRHIAAKCHQNISPCVTHT